MNSLFFTSDTRKFKPNHCTRVIKKRANFPMQAQLKGMYRNGNFVERMMATVLNAIITGKLSVFFFSKTIMLELLKNDPNAKRKTLSGQDYKMVLSAVRQRFVEVERWYSVFTVTKASGTESDCKYFTGKNNDLVRCQNRAGLFAIKPDDVLFQELCSKQEYDYRIAFGRFIQTDLKPRRCLMPEFSPSVFPCKKNKTNTNNSYTLGQNPLKNQEKTSDKEAPKIGGETKQDSSCYDPVRNLINGQSALRDSWFSTDPGHKFAFGEFQIDRVKRQDLGGMYGFGVGKYADRCNEIIETYLDALIAKGIKCEEEFYPFQVEQIFKACARIGGDVEAGVEGFKQCLIYAVENWDDLKSWGKFSGTKGKNILPLPNLNNILAPWRIGILWACVKRKLREDSIAPPVNYFDVDEDLTKRHVDRQSDALDSGEVMQQQPSQKAKRASERLFDFYQEKMQENGLQPSGALRPFQIRQVQDMLADLSEIQAKEMIEFAVKNWEYLRELDQDGKKLEQNPNLYQMVARWRCVKWYEMSQDKDFQQKMDAEIAKANAKSREMAVKKKIIEDAYGPQNWDGGKKLKEKMLEEYRKKRQSEKAEKNK